MGIVMGKAPRELMTSGNDMRVPGARELLAVLLEQNNTPKFQSPFSTLQSFSDPILIKVIDFLIEFFVLAILSTRI